MAKIGICDWGIGGLGTYKLLRERSLSSVDVIYFSDAGFTPYGRVPRNKLFERWLKVKNFFDKHEVDDIIVACNALSTVVEPEKGIITIATVVKELVNQYKNEKVAIIGGVRTIESGIYELGFEEHVFSVAQPLSALVEKGMIMGREVEEEITKIIDPIKDVRKVILACTHYPSLIPVMQKLYPEIEFIDPAEELINGLKLSLNGNGSLKCFTSGSPVEMNRCSSEVWNLSEIKAHGIHI